MLTVKDIYKDSQINSVELSVDPEKKKYHGFYNNFTYSTSGFIVCVAYIKNMGHSCLKQKKYFNIGYINKKWTIVIMILR